MSDVLKRLDDFVGSHKARCANIHIDDSYGACCWMVELFHENGRTCGQEVPFMEPPEEHVAYASMDDFTTLEEVLTATLDAFEAGMITPPREKPCNPSNDS